MTRLRFGYINGGVDPMSALEFGVFAERTGFDTLWVPDHFVDVDGDRLEPWAVLSATAVKTKRMTLASSVTDTQRTHPARTAHMVACVDAISGGRTILGIGSGEAMNIVPFGLPWDPPRQRVARLVEAIKVIRALWTSSRQDPTNFAGQFYRLTNAFLTQPPTQKPYPPIYVGAMASKSALQVVGRFGEGWYPWLNTPDTYRKRWSIIREAAESAGRSPEKIESVLHVMVAFPQNATEKRNALRAAKTCLILEKTILASLGYTSQTDHYQNLTCPSKEEVTKTLEAAKAVPDDVAYRTMAIGGSDEVKEKIDELLKVGVRHFAILNLLGPRTARRTIGSFRKIIRDYR